MSLIIISQGAGIDYESHCQNLEIQTFAQKTKVKCVCFYLYL